MSETEQKKFRWQFWIDVGGTFTDCVAVSPAGAMATYKTLSSGVVRGVLEQVDGNNVTDTRQVEPVENFWRGWQFYVRNQDGTLKFSTEVVAAKQGLLDLGCEVPSDIQVGDSYELVSGLEAPLICIRAIHGLTLDQSLPEIDVRMGTTRGTNALLERKGARTLFLVTAGFKDLLHIADQDRPHLFDLDIQKPQPLFDQVLEAEERISSTGEVLLPLNEETLRQQLAQCHQEGFESLAISFLHAYQYSQHEQTAERIAREVGFNSVSRSSAVAHSIKIVPRAETTVLDAYLNPILTDYVARIRSGLSSTSTLKLMTSQGGLVNGEHFTGKDSILSGPAGGVVAFSRIGQAAGHQQSIGFDMGGTSTDVSRFGGELEIQTETTKAGVRIASPTLAIETVAAGGGSICHFDGVQLQVGPESAGATPGPACYGAGGPLTVTDMNVLLGRVLPDQFPFPLDVAAIEQKLAAIRTDILQKTGRNYTNEELAQGFIDIANETMARAIRQVSIQKGYHPQDHLLVSFGGAGGQHACAMALRLGMKRLLIHPYAGILSAYGMGLAEIRQRSETSVLQPVSELTSPEIEQILSGLKHSLLEAMQAEGVEANAIEEENFSFRLRYLGLDASLVVAAVDLSSAVDKYHTEHQRLFGYSQPNRAVELVTVVGEAVAGRQEISQIVVPELSGVTAESTLMTEVWYAGSCLNVPVYTRESLIAGAKITGPAIVCDLGSTVWIEPAFRCSVCNDGSLLIEIEETTAATDQPSAEGEEIFEPDLIQLEIFNNQFASIAEQMGLTLRQTSVSTNVKERLDYSCAIFDAQAGLVVNAPHIPVHLGAMGETVKTLLAEAEEILPGDVFVTNDPYAGGSHLPDVTVITPVHHAETKELLFLTASRAHHAEIGGIRPGSMPPFSKNLAEEGVLIRRFKLIDQGEVREEELADLLSSGKYPSRNVQDNLADIRAQVAANQFGANLLLEMVMTYGLKQVLAYMSFIQQAACKKMQQALKRIPDGEYTFTDHLDDGSPIAVTISIEESRATIDFKGTGPVLSSNLNANRAIVTAACLYVFRTLIEDSIPLNSGVLEPLTIIIPESLLNPPRHDDPQQCAAMVGGNVETSQRVVDVLLGALGTAAASQGTMNNLTFGDDSFGYYETICGGAGATADSPGADAVHTHMTNTRLTDVEVIEHRYPVRVKRFEIRQDSGGNGKNPGGNGIIRTFEFIKPLQVSLLTQRRGPYPPFGLAGGSPGKIGKNSIQRAISNEPEEISGCVQLDVHPGDQLTIETPGGGGYG